MDQRLILSPGPGTDSAPLESDACYLALKTRDARFDGRFFTGVTSTGIYCRPVCKVRTPKRENCRFFGHAAAAERAGFRPCLRCRPELAPAAQAWSVQDTSASLALAAARLLDESEAWPGDAGGAAAPPLLAWVAQRLGISERHLRRLFEAHWGVSPLAYLQTRRLLTAKQLLADTQLPITQIAHASGFASVRRFNAAFGARYGLNPTQLRRAGRAPAGAAGAQAGSARVRLAWRPPYDVAAMLRFFGQRAIAGLEQVDEAGLTLTRSLALGPGTSEPVGWLHVRFDPTAHEVVLTASDTLRSALPRVIRRTRAALDLDAQPEAIAGVLGGAFPGTEGLRVPGAFCGYELAVRAILGQQVTVAAARTLAQRLVQAFGQPLATPWPGIDRLFPTPATLAAASDDALGRLGIVRQRQAALIALSTEVAAGRLALHGGADVPQTIAQLKALPGIGDWTAQYIAMRALRWPDAFPAGDVALHKALGVQGQPQPARAAEAASQAWRPWRSYAVIRAWAGLAATPSTSR